MVQAPAAQPHIVIVGGGAGGVELAARLGRVSRVRGLRVTLVDRSPAHLWKPRLHEVAAGLIDPSDDATNYLAHGYTHGYSFTLGALTGLDLESKTIRIGKVMSAATGSEVFGERALSYDTLVLALGSRVNDFGVPGVLEHCHMLDSPAQASRLQQLFLEASIQAAAGRLARLRVGIVGAGATGVELAAELHHAVHAMQRYGGLSAPGLLDIALVDQAPRVLVNADPRTSERAMRALRRLGVDVVLGQGVKEVTAAGLVLSDGQILPCDIKVWASGVVGHDVVAKLNGLALERGRRIAVDETLACVGTRDVYALGDCAAVKARSGEWLPPTAQAAHQQAGYLAQAILVRLAGGQAKPFRFQPRGTLVSLGPTDAAAEFGIPHRAHVLPAHGLLAKLIYVSLYHMHRVTLHGWFRATALFVADQLRSLTVPPVKLH
jgi:NADH dehydrogenase